MIRPLRTGEKILLADIANAAGLAAIVDALVPDMRAGLRIIADMPDPKPGDRGPVRHARHIAKTLLQRMDTSPC